MAGRRPLEGGRVGRADRRAGERQHRVEVAGLLVAAAEAEAQGVGRRVERDVEDAGVVGVEVRQCSHGGREVERAPRGASRRARRRPPPRPSCRRRPNRREELHRGEIRDAKFWSTTIFANWTRCNCWWCCLAVSWFRDHMPRSASSMPCSSCSCWRTVAFQSSPPPQVCCTTGRLRLLVRRQLPDAVEDVVLQHDQQWPPRVPLGFDLGGRERRRPGGFFLKGPNIVPPVASLPIQWRGVRRCKSWPARCGPNGSEYGGRHRGTEARRPTRLAARRRETRFYRGW